MQLKHLQTLMPAGDGAAKVTAFAWSPNNVKLASVTVDKVIVIFDENGEKRDKFSTKPAEAEGSKNYVVKGLAWSPDSTKLAVAQSDCIVFVYKLSTTPEKASQWGEKKSICNKFVQQSPVTCVTWPMQQGNNVVIGTMDGKVRLGNMRSNKSSTVYVAKSMCIALVPTMDGNGFFSSHIDGKIIKYTFADGSGQGVQSSLCTHSSAPYCIMPADSCVFAMGADKRLVVYQDTVGDDVGGAGRVLQQFDYAKVKGEREPSAVAASPSGQTVVVGSYDKLRVYNYNVRRKIWEEGAAKVIEHLYTVTALCWKSDGSRLAVGSLSGAVELFDCCLKRSIYRGKFELTYVGLSQVIVRKLATNARIVLRSSYNYPIDKVNVLGNDQFLVANTSETLLLGDLATCKLSEVQWKGTSNERFFFDNPSVCMIYHAGELTLIEYGVNDVLGTVRTEHVSPHLLSVRVNERGREESKKMAYLIDLRTIAITDLISGGSIATINHDARIDWMELSETGRKLLFRDKRRRLHLYDLASENRITLLSYCSYVQWVPGSDVVVAQSRNNLCIWYSIDHPERVTTFPIKGEVEDIERANGRTEVIVDEGMNQVSYALDEGLIEFGTAIDDGDLNRAVVFLETLEMTPETEAMWRTLAGLAQEREELVISERCYAALGDVAKVRFLHRINEVAQSELNDSRGKDNVEIRARLAALQRQFKLAETLYLEQGQTEAAMSMYQTLHKWDEAISVAEARNHPDLELMRRNYTSWLTETGQEEKAGELREAEGDYLAALNYYMKAGLPARAAQLVAKNPELARSQDIVERVSAALLKASLYDRAGELFQQVRMNQRALEAYRAGKVYRKAVELCRDVFPNEVVPLEEEWGDYLVAQKQLDAAINHYIEAGCMEKAVEAAFTARQWSKAAQMVEMQEPDMARPYLKLLADHYAEVRDYQLAERYYVKGHNARAAIDMYIKASLWDDAHRLSVKYMKKDDVADLYIQKAEQLEEHKKYKEAEKLYITVTEPDLAINMYKKARRFDDMIRLVAKYHSDLLVQTHLHLAKELEAEAQYAQAEQHYLSGEDWKSAVNMYRTHEMWEDAHRVAKQKGGATAAQQVGYLWAKTLGGDSAVKLLTKFGMMEIAIDFACEQNSFDFAFELARAAAKSKLPHVYLKHAMFLEDEGHFREAEEEFVKAAKPKEAVLMYVHAQDWDSAQRVAEAHDPESVADVLVGQARSAFKAGEFSRAETFLLRAQRPELAVRYYKEAGMWNDALRLAKEYLPHKLEELQDQYEKEHGATITSPKDMLAPARTFESNGDWDRAVEAYLKLTVEQNKDVDFLEEAWERAVEIAQKFLPGKAANVVSVVCARLMLLGRHEAAADLYLGVDMIKEAVDACIAGAHWDKARHLAKDTASEYQDYVEKQYVDYLKSNRAGADAADKLMNVDVIAGLDMLVERGEWDACIAKASKHGGGVLNKYAALFAANLVQEGLPVDALEVFVKHGAPATPQNLNIYRRIVNELLSERKELNFRVWSELRDVLFAVYTGLQSSGQPSAVQEEFERLCTIAHYFALRRAMLQDDELKFMSTKIIVSLLRHTDVLPADKAFYDAGMACRKLGWNGMAFVFLNRCLDLCEAIEEGSLDSLDNSDFVDTDIPFEIPLPDQPYLSTAEKEEVREWVLAVSVDQKVDQTLMTDARGCYAASLWDERQQKQSAPCILTGYPVLGPSVDLKNGKAASREDWNKLILVLKSKSNDNIQDCISFLGRFCGAPQNPTFAF